MENKVKLGFAAMTLVLLACSWSGLPTGEDPHFTQFDVEPGERCHNIPVRVSWKVDKGDISVLRNTCVRIYVDGTWAANQCLDEGLSGEVTVLFEDTFGVNVPSAVSVKGAVETSISREEYDQKSKSVKSRICQP